MNHKVGDDVIMTSLDMIRYWPHTIIHIKFGEGRMTNGRVIVQKVPFSSVISEP